MSAENEPIHIRKADIVLKRTALKLSQKYHMQWIGTGGEMMDNVNYMSLNFNIYRPLNIEEAREI